MARPRRDDHLGPESERTVSVLVVDDNQVFRETLRELVAAAVGFDLVGEVESGEKAIEAVGELHPDLVVMDIVMPGIGGIAAAGEIQSRCPGVVVMLISVEDPRLYPGVDALGDLLSARKQDLRPAELRRAWDRAARMKATQ